MLPRRLTAIAALLMTLASSPTWAQTSLNAQISRGVALRRQGRDASALEVFQSAWRSSRAPRALAQVALAEQALGRWVAAEAHLVEALAAAGYRLAHESGVRAVVLSGNGSVFCAGLDWGSFLAHGGNASERLLERPDGRRDNLAQRVSRTWADMPVPVIAALHGVAFGGGLQIALGADIRYAHPATQLSVMEIRYGLIPDMGLSTLLPRLVRDDVAKELTFTGRRVSGEEAARIGLVTRVCEDPLDAALDTAWRRWINDSFWLNPVVKAFDEGVARSVARVDGRDALLLQYRSGGVTPGDRYLWLLDENGLPRAWRMWVSIIPIGGLEASWEGWTRLSTGALVATRHQMGPKRMEIRDVAGAETLSALVSGADPFAALTR